VSDNDVRLRVRVETQGSAQRTASELERINQAMLETSQAAQNVRREADQAAQSLRDAASAQGELERAQRQAQAQKTLESLKRDPFGALGDLVAKVPVLKDFAPLVNILTVAKEFQDLFVQIRDTTTVLQNLGGAIRALTAAAGLAAVTVGLLVFAYYQVTQAARDQAQAFNELLDAYRSVLDEIAGGATRQDIEATIEKLRFRRELEQAFLDEQVQAYETFFNDIRTAFEERLGVIGTLIAKVLDPFIRLFDAREEALASQIDKSRQKIEQLEAQERAYTRALEKGLTQRNDARKAEEALAQAQENLASSAGPASSALERQSEALRAAEQAQREAEARAQRAAQAQQRYAESVAQAANAYADATAQARRNLAQARQDARTSLARDLADQAIKLQEDIANARTRALDQEAQALRAQQDRIAALRRRAQQQEEDAIRARDFLALDRLARETQRELDEEGERASQERRERQIAYDQQLRDLQIAAQRERQARQIAYQRQLQDALTNYQRELQQAAIARAQALRNAQEALRRELELNAQFYAQREALARASISGGSPQTGASPSPFAVGGGGARMGSRTFVNNFNISGANDARGVQLAIERALGNLGVAR